MCVRVDCFIGSHSLRPRCELLLAAVLDAHLQNYQKYAAMHHNRQFCKLLPLDAQHLYYLPEFRLQEQYYYTNTVCLLLGQYTIPEHYSMGNENPKQTTCSKLCNKTTVIDYNPDDILVTEFIVPCQICNTQFKHNDLKQHIDITHYATIQEQKNGNAIVQCLLCNQLTPDLINHATHITEKHPFAIKSLEKQSRIGSQVSNQSVKMHRRVEEWQLNRYKKSAAVKLESDKDFQIIKQISDNVYEGAINGVSYLVHKQCKQYKGADFNTQLMEAEMVWFSVFNQKKCKYYYLGVEAGQRNILCRSFIFLPHDKTSEGK